MSIHKSLKCDTFKVQRNVRKRYERYEKLVRNEKFVKNLSCFGMPKEKIVKIIYKIKEEKAEEIGTLIPIDALPDKKKGKK